MRTFLLSCCRTQTSQVREDVSTVGVQTHIGSCVHYEELNVCSPSRVGGLQGSHSRRWIGGELRATAGGRNGRYGGIGSGRKRRGAARKDKMQAETETTEPFLEPQMRTAKEEGHQVLQDVEYLHLRATNPYGLVLEIAEEANEYLRNNKEDSLLRKPVLKMISDRINEDAGEQIRDSYIDDHPDSEKYETM
ncbi:hypothetical protein R1sor_021844 [Riccia sorocarpa]|uniref:Uncharacterized protein n=1 Tax=Riccia sorocarpa TaxID=122646 RepID=A0ABD3GI75_9MARC